MRCHSSAVCAAKIYEIAGEDTLHAVVRAVYVADGGGMRLRFLNKSIQAAIEDGSAAAGLHDEYVLVHCQKLN